ncbi:helix-turn-helix domain-containing protein [Oceanihabitans sp. 2_MG-2023]|uniref:helix-turn-helix domain-containing protein n=1 Tax=Oceanihabitans sp. 2_MG-2023 TaxID=3062661 RepID=UPI0026E335DC|nr:helix-turn-helix domain-containing protein [Oceanihabitans sp. 2_MG-2023]MDO6595650.1 helix-turn-helix domain-containing protein [Oceanihabitans sp. 2_MG-2023]
MNELNFNIFNLLIILGVLHGVIFSIIVFSQKKYITNNTLYLGLVVLFLSFSNLQYWLLDTSLINSHAVFKYIYIPWHWLVLPMFYLYVYKFLGNKTIGLKRRLLLSPFFIVLSIHLLQLLYKFFINNEYIIPSHFKRGIFVYLEFASFIFNVLVMYFTYKMITDYEKDKTYNIKWITSETNWLKKLIFSGLLVCICWLIAIIIVVVFNLNKTMFFYPMWICISVLVYWIGYSGLNKSTQLRNRIELRQKRILEFRVKEEKSINKSDSKSFNKIEKLIKQDRLYLNPKLNLKYLSNTLNLSEGYISQTLNANSKLNFNDYVNTLRIKDAKQMLVNSEFDNYTIVTIGLECGFNSKTSFYTAFKKFTNKTPSEFKKDVRNL